MKLRLFSRHSGILSFLTIAAALVASLLSHTPATAATYYVASNGSNSNNGTKDLPFSTIGQGLSVMKAGDTLFIRGGTYTETLDSNKQKFPIGTSWDNAPQIKAYPGETVILMPRGETNLVSSTEANPYIIQYIIFDGLIFDGTNWSHTGQTITGQGISLNAVKYIRIQNGEIRNYRYGNGIQFATGRGPSEFHQLINLKIYNNGTLNCCTSGQVGHGIYGSGSNILYDHLEIHHNGAWGIQFYSAIGGVDNNIISNSSIHDNGVALASGGLYVGSGINNLAYNNIIYNNPGYAVMIDPSGVNAKIYNNTITGNSLEGMYNEGTRADIQNNIIYGNGAGFYDGGTNTVKPSQPNNLTTNPLFVNASGANFQLQSGSPAIDKGVTLALVTGDINGTPRPAGGGYDVGAFEFGQPRPPSLAKPTMLRIVYP